MAENQYIDVWNKTANHLDAISHGESESGSTPHTHTISDITGLDSTIEKVKTDNKLDADHRNNMGIHVTAEEKEKWNSGNVATDTSLDSSSTSPIANKAVYAALENKVNKIDIEPHLTNTNIHVTAEEKEKWNAKTSIKVDSEITALSENPVSSKAIYEELNKKANTYDIAEISDIEDLKFHVSDGSVHVTAEEKEKWNNNNVTVETSINDSENPISSKAVKDALKDVATNNDISGFVSEEDFESHATNMVLHVTEEEKAAWNSKDVRVDQELDSESIRPISNKAVSEEVNKLATKANLSNHTMDNVSHVTKQDRERWDSKTSVNIDNEITDTSNNAVSSKTIYAELQKKIDKADVPSIEDTGSMKSHMNNEDIHVTKDDKSRWDSYKVTVESSVNNSSNPISSSAVNSAVTKLATKTEMETKLDSEIFKNHNEDTNIHVTAEEKEKWNAKSIPLADINISKEKENILEKKTDGLFVPSVEVSKTSNNILMIQDDGLYVEKQRFVPHINIADTVTYGMYTFKKNMETLSVGEILQLNEVHANGINMSYDGYLVLPSNKKFMIDISIDDYKSGSSSCGGLVVYDENENEVTSAFKYDSSSVNYESGSNNYARPVIYETGDKEMKIYVKVTESYNDWKINEHSTLRIVEIGNNVNVDFRDTVQSLNHEDIPVGTVISYMGETAPAHYLLCDGSTYNISDYQYLANAIMNEFGSYNYWGGDGKTTFAVPDMRNEFIRGFGDKSTELGKHQDPTYIPWVSNDQDAIEYLASTEHLNDGFGEPKNIDEFLFDSEKYSYKLSGNPSTWKTFDAKETARDTHYSSRPTNTSVNFCIKAEPTPYLNVTNNGNIERERVWEGTLNKTDTTISWSRDISSFDYLLVTVKNKTEDVDTDYLISLSLERFDDYSSHSLVFYCNDDVHFTFEGKFSKKSFTLNLFTGSKDIDINHVFIRAIDAISIK